MKPRWWKFSILLLALVMAFSVVGCSAEPEANKASDQETKVEQKADEVSYPVTVTGDDGEKVTLTEEPKRIISLIPSTTEIAFALGLGDRVVGVTANDDYPAEVSEIEQVGDMNINAEKVMELKPDLVLGANMNGDAIKKLRGLGLNVLVAEGQNLEGVYKSIENVGEATNQVAEAKKVVAEMKDDVAKVESAVADLSEDERVDVWYEVSADLYTTGKNTFMNELITVAGGNNVAASQEGWVQVSAEKVVEWNPEVIIFTHGETEKAASAQISDRAGWGKIQAVKEDRLQQLDGNLVSRPGPRITKGLLEVATALYPERF
ncbi:ABC transporter substrate-binding protein [Mechercharimyces sp. CAU 1602]|uniref:ABC transporter substrate-binding protein n=1 Tax=Mechercharimyces sp. CAU 1602 TaxID=2973933 RepID=UPI002161C72A|nr:ABC transporter substrate-binding protein [Mechercharimyces sp. CAU 1602]MCS1351976.1 ABC transporter substrate-binding protein [Mechercharimyces sp. CAU 1602]